MNRDERTTCRELIEPALREKGWELDPQVRIGPGRVSIAGPTMYDPSQEIVADYLLRLWGMPLAVLEAKRESEDPEDALQQAQRYAERLGLRFAIASNGHRHLVLDVTRNERVEFGALPSPGDVLARWGRNAMPQDWKGVFTAPWRVDQITRKEPRPYQQMAVYEALYAFSQGEKRVLLLMATGTGKTFTVFQLVWKLMQGEVLRRGRVLFLTDRNHLKDQAFVAFAGFSDAERVVLDKQRVSERRHETGKVYFANYQNLDEELDGRKLYEHLPPDFFDLVIIDECHRSGFGDWFGVLEHFGAAMQLGLTATPREFDSEDRELAPEVERRDTYRYFKDPVFEYSLRQAIDDGYLVPYLLESRVTNVDDEGWVGPDGTRWTTADFEREIRMPERSSALAEDLWKLLGQYDKREAKAIVFCVDDTHAAVMAQELRRVSGDSQYAARIVRSERNSEQLQRRFAEVGASRPRVACTVDLLTTGYDAPDVEVVVFARPLRSAILYKQMKGRGTRLCQDVDKRYFTIVDYTNASALEDAEWDGHPANRQKPDKPRGPRPTKKDAPARALEVAKGVEVFIARSERFVCFADGKRVPFEEYRERSREVIRTLARPALDDLMHLWVDRASRKELREALVDREVYVSALRRFMDLEAQDDVDVLAKVGFDLARVPTRHDRVVRFWGDDRDWLLDRVGEGVPAEGERFRSAFWEVCLDHYGLFGIDDLEVGSTYGAPQFTSRFGSFGSFAQRYGGATKLRADLEAVKARLYVPMVA
ncbi:MAG: DEAD/DEAH box helicase family protein [Polyangiales bacterium]